jgi:hypothetical protein
MSDDLRKWTWDKDDVEWEFEADPNAKPLLTPEQLEEAKKNLEYLKDKS